MNNKTIIKSHKWFAFADIENKRKAKSGKQITRSAINGMEEDRKTENRVRKPRIHAWKYAPFGLRHGLFAFLLVLFSCNNPNNENTEEVSIPVSVEEVVPKSIEQYVETSGTVYPSHEATLRTEITARYFLQDNPRTGQPFKLGDFVQEGETIVKLEDAEYENSTTIESKKLNLDISKRLYDQQKSLYDKGGVTLRELTDAERSYIDAKYAYENAEIAIDKMKITAPFSGTLVELPYFTPGVKINTGNTAAKIMAYKELYLNIDLPEKEMGQVKSGHDVRVFNYSYPSDTFMAKVTQLSPVINAASRSFKGHISVSNPDLKLRPGMFVKAEIITAFRDSAIVIPRDLVLTKQKGPVVFVVERSTAHEKDLVLGLENPTEVEIVNGLEPEDRLVVKGYETLRHRSKVKVVK
jgi:membrane fusion protein, multidrug efflux system